MLNKVYHLILAAFLITFSLNTALYAQDKDDKFRDKIEKIKIEKLIKKLELDDNTAEIFITKYKDFSKLIKDLNKKRFAAYRLMVENLESGSGLDTLVEHVLGYESLINDEREKFAEDLKTILNLKQIATMIVFERKFNNEIRKLLKDFKQENKKNK
jgi:Asp-tRNA(Asn)/Glu-tRNA(Gln) amidotransferase C subunit